MKKPIILKDITYDSDPCTHCKNLVFITPSFAYCYYLKRRLDNDVDSVRCDGNGWDVRK